MTEKEREEMDRGTSEVFDHAEELIRKYKTAPIPYTIGQITAMIYLLSMIMESLYGRGTVAVNWAAKGMKQGTHTYIRFDDEGENK